MDLGPNLGAINRSALIAADYVVVPLLPGLSSLQGLNNLGLTLRRWRGEWQERLLKMLRDYLELISVAFVVLAEWPRVDNLI